jgi:hypothetical protein
MLVDKIHATDKDAHIMLALVDKIHATDERRRSNQACQHVSNVQPDAFQTK